MIALLRFTVAAISVLAMSAWAHAASQSKVQPATVDTLKPRLTVLYDAFGKASDMRKDWGYSALVEVGGKRILFDTGNDPAIFANNVKAKGIDLTKIDFVVMSHRHGDHMGGLSHVLAVNPTVKIYAPKESFGVYGSSLPSSFYRRAEGLPADMRYFDGAPPEVMKFGSAWPGANFELIDKTTEIAPGIHLIALISDKPGTLELKELSLALDTPEGVILIVGCSHPGIDKIVESATAINKRVHMIAGGLHLAVAQDAEIAKVVASLHDAYGVAWVAPGHCTGEPTFAALQQVFGDRYLYAGLGTVIGLGANPRATLEGARNFAMSEEDLGDYRRNMRRNLVSFGRHSR
jgi:7,8-dihydropterin-6-yl-methyl-4-(beta-D-ribofuranosyl)aminobenzene 5'-phosphate synthase